MDLTPRLDLIILDCPDALELAAFYSGLLGWPFEDGADRDFATLRPPGGGVSPDNPDGRATLAFQRIEDWVAPTWPGGRHPQQVHLDFSVGDSTAPSPTSSAWGHAPTSTSPPRTAASACTSTPWVTRSA